MYGKWLVFIILILAVLSIIMPRASIIEGFNELQGKMILDNVNSKKYSTMIYLDNKSTTEQDYLNAYDESYPIGSLAGEPFVMNRCIQFMNDPGRGTGGMDDIIAKLHADNKFFVSERVTFPYEMYDTLEQNIFNTVKRLYVESNAIAYIPQFYSPCYVLISQYPFMRTVKPDCSVVPRTLQWNAIDNDYNPKSIFSTPNCQAVAGDTSRQVLWIEFYILMPAHSVTVRNGKRLVGPLTYRTWDEIRCNMRRLFAYNPVKSYGVSTVDPRSFDDKCQFKCLSDSSNRYKYMCGARNHRRERGRTFPYESTVLGTHNDLIRHDYGILYLLNGEVINERFNLDVMRGIFGRCIDHQAIPSSYNTTTASCTTIRKPSIPVGPQITLLPMEDVPFQIRVMNKCLALGDQNQPILKDCIVDDPRQRWSIDKMSVPGETEFLYLLYVTVGGRRFYLTKNLFNAPTFTTNKPNNTAFKPRSERQLRLVEISRSGINWNTERFFCLTVVNNAMIFLSQCASDSNIVSYSPLALPLTICGTDLTNDEYRRNLENARS